MKKLMVILSLYGLVILSSLVECFDGTFTQSRVKLETFMCNIYVEKAADN